MASRKPKINVRRDPTLRKRLVKHSKRVTDRIKTADTLRGSIANFSDGEAAGLSERFASELRDGEVVPDCAKPLVLNSLRSRDHLPSGSPGIFSTDS